MPGSVSLPYEGSGQQLQTQNVVRPKPAAVFVRELEKREQDEVTRGENGALSKAEVPRWVETILQARLQSFINAFANPCYIPPDDATLKAEKALEQTLTSSLSSAAPPTPTVPPPLPPAPPPTAPPPPLTETPAATEPNGTDEQSGTAAAESKETKKQKQAPKAAAAAKDVKEPPKEQQKESLPPCNICIVPKKQPDETDGADEDVQLRVVRYGEGTCNLPFWGKVIDANAALCVARPNLFHIGPIHGPRCVVSCHETTTSMN